MNLYIAHQQVLCSLEGGVDNELLCFKEDGWNKKCHVAWKDVHAIEWHD